ncbi:tetratricopeptide repeat protein [Streptomyces spongiicola]|uniref:Tetratricopeptide repeat protein n=1 Tax=Streptomyces spongiicola TaxID=1690221 RepID=A0A388SWP2_9ACTN|nr:FxSxx-COOH system tetratricopeptide repeat protein [Streptomyces spongiicola]GBQ00160.1 tetratricopeptide repeat protein [Streptomyces spongiicola]
MAEDAAGGTEREVTGNDLSGTVHGPVVQARTVVGGVHTHIHESGLPPASDVHAFTPVANPPRPPSGRLWGRDDDLDEVVRQLEAPSDDGFGVALVGMPGVGKTELALHAARKLRARYRLTWWVSAQDGGAVTRGLAALAHHLLPGHRQWRTPADAAAWAMDWLHHHDGWLLVLDSVETPSDVAAVLARIDRGPVVVTTRWHVDWTECGLAATTVEPLPAPVGAAWLSGRTGLDADDGAHRLAADLGGLPLALQQASAYLRAQGLSYEGYQRLLDAEPGELLDSPAWTDVYRRNTARSLRLSVDAVAALRPSAVHLLRTACCYAPETIPLGLLAPESQTSLRQRSDIELLRSYSLITADGGSVSIHQLLRRLLRSGMTVDGGEAATACELLRSALPEDPFSTVADWPHWLRLISHTEALDAFVDSIGGVPGQAVADLAGALHGVGTFMLAQGWTGQARGSLARAAERRTAALGEEHADTLASRHRLGEALRALGSHEEALDVHSATLDARLRLHGAEHRLTLQTREALAITCKALGRTDEAIVQHEAILRDRATALGDDHTDVLWSMHNLALTYKQAGRLDEALHLHRQVLERRTAVLGPDHPDTLRCLHNIANTHHDARRYEEAVAAQEQSVADRVRVLGPEHRDTLRSQSNLADSYLAAGRVPEAVALHERTLAQRERALGPEEPDTRWSRERLEAAREQQHRAPGPDGSP